MELVAVSVRGVRSLAALDSTHLRNPAILTGPNDGGKTSLIMSIGFLLGEWNPQPDDYTREKTSETGRVRDSESNDFVCVVEGDVRLSDSEQEALSLPAELRVRRRLRRSEASVLEVLQRVPRDPRLRELDRASLQELREWAAALGVEPVGPKNMKASYLTPLQERASKASTRLSWVLAAGELAKALPRFVLFASTAEPNPEAEIRVALGTAYQKVLEQDEIVGPVREAEERVQQELKNEAMALCRHVARRWPEFKDIDVVPTVSFREGFSGVRVLIPRGDSPGESLAQSGAGRRRRLTLAVWEWTNEILTGSDDGRSAVVAYDEPDTHLDYGRQRKLVDLIRAQAEIPGVQVIVATHSLNLIDKVPIENLIHLTLDEDDHTTAVSLVSEDHSDIDQYLLDVAASMGLRNSVLLHERCFLAVEGLTELQSFPWLFRVTTGLSLQAAGLALIPAHGNTGALRFAEYLNSRNRNVQFIVDRDSQTKNQDVFSPVKLRKVGIQPDQIHLIGEPDELEDLFSNSRWAQTANAAWPRDDRRPWRSPDFAALRGKGKFSEALHGAIRDASSAAPKSKAVLTAEVARSISVRGEVPRQLRVVFDSLLASVS